MATPIWAQEGIALDSTGEMVANSLAHRMVALQAGMDNVPKFGGDLWYVDGTNGDDGNAGTSPDAAFATIGAGIAAAAAGDAINVKYGAYDETGLDLALDGLELWAEIGASLVDTAGGAATLTVSGDFVRVRGLHLGEAGQVAVLVTGDHCELDNVHVDASTVAFDINGAHGLYDTLLCSGYTVTGVDLASAENRFFSLDADGGGAAVRGIYLSAAGADGNSFRNCATRSNATAGWEVVAGATGNVFSNCGTSNGDGRWVDTTDANLWEGFAFDSVRANEVTITAGLTYNLFQIVGTVQINYLYGIVTTVLPAAVTTASFDLFPAGGAGIPLTLLAGVDVSAAPVGSMLAKSNTAAAALTYSDSTLGFLAENLGNLFTRFTVGQQTAGVDTYVRFVRAGAGASGVIHWHVDWEPLSDDGFLTIAP